jgi:glycosyltransferase involved in cell wall biosynthesis
MVIANPLAKLAGVPAVITTFHHMAGPGRIITNQRLHGLYYRLEGLVGRWATDICVCYAEPARRDAIAVRGVPEDRVAVVDNGIDLRRFTPLEGPDRRKARAAARDRLRLPPGSFVVGAVGRMIHAKGHQHLVAALVQIRSARPDAVLVIIGDGPLAGRVRDQVGSLGLDGITFFPGALPVTPELYAAFDVFVYPSIVGVFGLVVLEAMACGVPVVASDLPGSEILLADGVDALVVPPGDPAAIAGAVLRLADDQELAQELAARAADHVRQRFSAETMINRYLALYRGVLAHEPAPAVYEAPGS